MDKIEPSKKVAHLLESYPQTYHVFRKYGCPDMRSGFFSYMARLIHRIPLDKLTSDLEESITQSKKVDPADII